MNYQMTIRVAANPRCGTRKVSRALTLAKAWTEGGNRASLSTPPLPGVLRRKIHQSACVHDEWNLPSDPSEIVAYIERKIVTEKTDWLVVDDSGLDDILTSRQVDRWWRDLQCRTLVYRPLDGWQLGGGAASVGPISRPCGEAIAFGALPAPEQGECSVAYPFAVLPFEYDSDLVSACRTSRKAAGEVVARQNERLSRRCLLLVADSDLLPPVIEMLNQAFTEPWAIDLVGPSLSMADVESLRLLGDSPVRYHRNVDRVVDLLPGVDLAITSQDAADCELDYLGLDYCGVPHVSLFKDSVRCLAEPRSAFGERVSTAGDSASWCDGVQQAVRDVLARRTVGARSELGLVDDHGAYRLCQFLTQGHQYPGEPKSVSSAIQRRA